VEKAVTVVDCYNFRSLYPSIVFRAAGTSACQRLYPLICTLNFSVEPVRPTFKRLNFAQNYKNWVCA